MTIVSPTPMKSPIPIPLTAAMSSGLRLNHIARWSSVSPGRTTIVAHGSGSGVGTGVGVADAAMAGGTGVGVEVTDAAWACGTGVIVAAPTADASPL